MKNLFILVTLFFAITSSAKEHVFLDSEIGSKYRKDSIEVLKTRMLEIADEKAKFPTQDQTFNLEGLGSFILKFDLADKQGTVINNRRREELTIDFDADQCIKHVPNYCDIYARNMSEYKKDYAQAYRAKKIIYPTINLEKMTYTMPNGTGYNLTTGSPSMQVSTSLVQTTTTVPVKTIQPVVPAKKKVANGIQSAPKKY